MVDKKFEVTMSAAYGFIESAENEAEAEEKAKLKLHGEYPSIPLETLSSDLFYWDTSPVR